MAALKQPLFTIHH